MPFGSAMNAFGLINQGKGMTAEEFVEQMKIIMKFAEDLEKPKNNDIKREDIRIPQQTSR